MNYRNHSMSELVTVLSTEQDHHVFIEAAKVFIQKFVDGNYVPREIHDEAISEREHAAEMKGYDEARDNCREEALRIIDANKCWLLHDGYQEDWNQMRPLFMVIG